MIHNTTKMSIVLPATYKYSYPVKVVLDNSFAANCFCNAGIHNTDMDQFVTI